MWWTLSHDSTDKHFNTSSVYNKTAGKTLERKVASCNCNSSAPGKLDSFLHVLYSMSGNKQF